MAERPAFRLDLGPRARTGFGTPGPVSSAILGAGAVLVVAGVRRRGRAGLGMAALGSGLVFRGATGIGPLARMADAAAPPPRDADLGPVARAQRNEQGSRATVTVILSREDAYRYLITPENVAALALWAGRDVSADDLSLMASHDDVMATWRIGEGGSGSTAAFALTDAPAGRGTEVRLSVVFDDAGGPSLVTHAARRIRDEAVRESLRRFKQLVEAGELARAGEPSARAIPSQSRFAAPEQAREVAA